jgi:two-component system, NarL family, nitrate/nitrite response regulator NarL
MARVFIVAGIRLFREGLAAALEREHGFTVAGTASSADEAAVALQDGAPDVVLLDTLTPDAATAIRRIRAANPEARVVALGVPDEDERVIAWAEAGVASYLAREASLAELAEALDSLARGEAVCSPRIAAALLRRVATLAGARPANGAAGTLTSREREIVALIDEGLSNKEIARRLVIEVATVKNHVHNILEKLRVGTRGEAAAVVRRGA